MLGKAKKVGIISSIVLVGFVVGVVFHYIWGAYLKLPPLNFNTFLYDPSTHFNDFTDMMPISKSLAPFSEPKIWVNYFPLAYIILFPFSLIPNVLVAYYIFTFVFLAFLTYMNIKNFTCVNLTNLQNFQNIFIIGVLSYPVLYIIDRGNIDMFLFILFAGFVWLFKYEKYFLSAILLGIQNAIKPFPILFLILFLFKKKYNEFFLSIVLTGLLIVGGFMFLKGSFFDQVTVFIQNLIMFKLNYVYSNNSNCGMTDTSSLFTTLKLIFCNYTSILSTIQLEKLYSYLSLIILSVIIFFTQKEKTFWKKITLLTFLMLFLPYIIDDYKLVFLFVPIWLFVNAEEKTKFDSIYSVLFGLLIIPKTFIILFRHVGNLSQITTFGIVINPILMMIFMGLIIWEQFLSNKEKKK